jgi:hypothetical protein
MRKYPDVFTTRTIFNQFVSRGFKDENELRKAVESLVSKAIEPKAEELKQTDKQRAEMKTATLKN